MPKDARHRQAWNRHGQQGHEDAEGHKNLMKSFLAVVALFALTAPASAFYTECTVSKDIELANRPDGQTEPRYMPVNKGDKVGVHDEYQDWWFVMHSSDGSTDYGWLPKKVLTRCKQMEGTP